MLTVIKRCNSVSVGYNYVTGMTDLILDAEHPSPRWYDVCEATKFANDIAKLLAEEPAPREGHQKQKDQGPDMFILCVC